MPVDKFMKIRTNHRDLFLRVSRGHFATNHSHINYYIDVSTQKTRLSETTALAEQLVSYYSSNTIIDAILCLDGTEVIGTCLAKELTKSGFSNLNAHQTIYIVTPEHTSGSQIIFRDNMVPMISGKNVLILAASVTTGYTAKSAIEAVKYYNAQVSGVCAIFSTADQCMGYPVHAVFNPNNLDGYASYESHECPMCKAGQKIDALVNGFGYSKLR